MNDWKFAITLTICCATYLTAAASASADYVGVTALYNDDPDIDYLCVNAKGDYVFYPLTVCSVSAVFDNPDDVLLSVANADLQAYNGQNPDGFFQHVFNASSIAPPCVLIPVFPDLICDAFVTIGVKCSDGSDGSTTDSDFDASEFNENGHVVGGWFNSSPANGQGRAGQYPDLHVLFLQSSVEEGLTLSGVIDLFWAADYGGDVYAELAVLVECPVACPDDYLCDDGDICTIGDVCQNQVCQGMPIDCDDGNPCTEDSCVPDEGQCLHVPLPDGTSCDDGNACTVGGECANGKCGGGLPIDCDDDNACTDDGCDPEYGGCTHYDVGCDDDNDCTDDYCDPGSGCVNMPNDNNCADGNPCTDDYCDPASGCVNMPNDDPCDDGDLCTVNDHCGEDGCVHGTPIDCDDGNECTENTCNPATGECTSDPIECDDGDQCTDDACDPDTGCTHEDIVCPEGQLCDPASGECVEDQDPCECVNGRVTLCHIPPGHFDNAHTITVGCAARDKHLAHGDICGPCE